MFVMLPNRMLESAAYASLDLTARALLQDLIMLYKGYNNGSLYLSAKDATDRLGLSDKRAVLRAFEDLQDRGFITLAKDAHFSIKAAESSRARCWRLTWHAWAESPVKGHKAPTNAWEKYQAPGQTAASRRAHKRLEALSRYRKENAAGHFPGVKSSPMEPIMPKKTTRAGVKSSPAKSEKDANPPFLVGVDSSPYIDTTMGSGAGGWCAPASEVRLLSQVLYLTVLATSQPRMAHAA